MRTFTQQDRLFGQALTETRRPRTMLAGLFLTAVLFQAALAAAHLATPLLVEQLGWTGGEALLGLLDVARPDSLAAFYSAVLLLAGSAVCLALARFERRGERADRAWKWGAFALAFLALDQTTGLGTMIASLFDAGVAGRPVDGTLAVGWSYLLLFGGFFGIALWRVRGSILALLGLSLGYGAWALSYIGLDALPWLTTLELDAAEATALTTSLWTVGTALVLLALYGNLLRSARKTAPLPILRRVRPAA